MLIKNTQILPSIFLLFLLFFGINASNATSENNVSQKRLIIDELTQKSNTKKSLSSNKKVDSTIQRLINKPSLMKTATALNAVQTKNPVNGSSLCKSFGYNSESIIRIKELRLRN